MTLFEFLLLLVIAVVCGGVGQLLVGYNTGCAHMSQLGRRHSSLHRVPVLLAVQAQRMMGMIGKTHPPTHSPTHPLTPTPFGQARLD